MEIITILLPILAICFLIGVARYIIRAYKTSYEYIMFVDNGSTVILDNIRGLGITHNSIKRSLKSLPQWRKFSAFDFLLDVIEDDDQLYNHFKDNLQIWGTEMVRLDNRFIKMLDKFEGSDIGFFKKRVIRKDLTKGRNLSLSLMNRPIYDIRWTYTSPKGRNHYEKYCHFYIDDMLNILDKVDRRKEYKKGRKYQRSLMAPGLRYDVLKRDDFMCKICGASADDGVKLHVDHIQPIAKGGLTEMNNLQVLCDVCNLGKGAKY